MVLRYYPAIIGQDVDDRPEDGYGIIFPDIPGCTSGGDTIQAAAINAIEALALHIEGMLEDKTPLPEPSAPDAPLPDWLETVPGKVSARVLVPVELPGRAVRANVTIDEGLLARLDAAAAAEGTSRSGFIAQAVRERLRLLAPMPSDR